MTVYWNCFLSPVATVGMDGNGLKLDKIGQFFSIFDATCSKNPQEIYSLITCIWYRRGFTEAFCLWLKPQSIMILAQNWPKTAKISWHCSFKNQWDFEMLCPKHSLVTYSSFLRFSFPTLGLQTKTRSCELVQFTAKQWMSVKNNASHNQNNGPRKLKRSIHIRFAENNFRKNLTRFTAFNYWDHHTGERSSHLTFQGEKTKAAYESCLFLTVCRASR